MFPADVNIERFAWGRYLVQWCLDTVLDGLLEHFAFTQPYPAVYLSLRSQPLALWGCHLVCCDGLHQLFAHFGIFQVKAWAFLHPAVVTSA